MTALYPVDDRSLFVFGLTGGVASGKSTVARYLRAHGVTVIDADELAREVVAPGSDALRQIEMSFGFGVVQGGVLDRTALAKIVFSDGAALARLNQITHPQVAALFQKRLAALRRAARSSEPRLVCYEVPLLFENGLEAELRPVVVVHCPVEQQISRAIQRNGWSRAHAEQRIGTQMPLAKKCVAADYVINNDSSLQELERRTEEVLACLTAEAQARAADALA